MINCENCGKPLDHDFADVGMCPHCLDGAVDSDEGYFQPGHLYKANWEWDTVLEDDY